MLYVADSHQIIGQPEEEQALLARATAWGAGELALYGLGPLLEPSTQGARALESFANRARARGIALVAPIAGIDRPTALERFEGAHPHARFAGWVTELEYWHECGNERRGSRTCFAPLDRLLSAMSAAAMRRGERPWIGVYLGYPTREEARSIGRRADRVLLSYTGTTPRAALADRRDPLRSPARRLAHFAAVRAELWPILYARGEVPMDGWVRPRAERGVPAGLQAAEHEIGLGLGERRQGGFAWFDYRGMTSLER